MQYRYFVLSAKINLSSFRHEKTINFVISGGVKKTKIRNFASFRPFVISGRKTK